MLWLEVIHPNTSVSKTSLDKPDHSLRVMKKHASDTGSRVEDADASPVSSLRRATPSGPRRQVFRLVGLYIFLVTSGSAGAAGLAADQPVNPPSAAIAGDAGQDAPRSRNQGSGLLPGDDAPARQTRPRTPRETSPHRNAAVRSDLSEIAAALKRCAGHLDPVRLAVITQSGGALARLVTAEQLEDLRFQTEQLLNKIERVRLIPLREPEVFEFMASKGATDEELRRSTHDTKANVDLLVLMNPRTNLDEGQSVEVALRMISVSDGVSACSESRRITLAMKKSGPIDIDAVLEGFASDLYGRISGRDVGRIVVNRFSTGQYATECDDALRWRMVSALQRESPPDLGQRQPDIVASNGETLAVRSSGTEKDGGAEANSEDIELLGVYLSSPGPRPRFAGQRHHARVSISAKARRSGRNGATEIYSIAGIEVFLSCNPQPRDFFDQIRLGQNVEKDKLQLYPVEKNPRVGDPVRFRIWSHTAETLYCWYINPERTAYILTPHPGAFGTKSQRTDVTREFPSSFRNIREQTFGSPSKDMFGCFLPPGDITDTEPHNAWMAASIWNSPPDSGPQLLDEAKISELLRMMRSIPGIAEDYTSFVVEPAHRD